MGQAFQGGNVGGGVGGEGLKRGGDLRAGVAWGWWLCRSLLGSGSRLTAWDSWIRIHAMPCLSYCRRTSKVWFFM